ncbi:MAG TPA: DNA polymerase I [Pirellulales bacterium]
MAKIMRQGTFAEMEDHAPQTGAAPCKKPAAEGARAVREKPQATAQLPVERPQPPESLRGARVWVVDANSLIFQVFHALPEMSSPRGEPVSAVFGFARDMLYLLEEKQPTHLFVAFDGSERTFRHDLYEQYKAHRASMPDDLSPQYGPICQMLEALNVAMVELDNYEADDLMATIAHQVNELEGECVLVTGDKDARQLITDRVWVYNIRKDQMYDAAALKADWGVHPEQVVDFQALVGDSVDNVPGVPLVGPKIAAEYLQKHETLDGLYEHVLELPKGKRRDNLIQWREQALMSRRLVRLERHVPIEIDWEAARVRGVDRARLNELFTHLGFHSLAQKFSALPEQTRAEPAAGTYEAIDSQERLDWLIAELSQQDSFALSLETTHVWPRWAEIVGYAFSFREAEAYYVPVRGPEGTCCFDGPKVLAALRPVLENPAVEKVGRDLKYDMVVLRAAGVQLAGARFDDMVASYLLDAGERKHQLDETSERLLNHKTMPLAELIGSGKNQKGIAEVPLAGIARYAGEQADIALRLRPMLSERLRQSELDNLFETVEMPLVEVLSEIESTGIKVDVALLGRLSARYGELLNKLEAEIYELAGRQFNIGSPKQLQQILFEEHNLPVLKRTKSGGSTDADVLEELARLHPLPAKIIEFRQYAKLKSTYLDALPAQVHPLTGRVHATFNQTVAATGRLSAQDPNLQNIPVRAETGREIRAAFLPGHPGWKLLAADYSQIELRVLAHFSQDATLCAAFERDEDVHARVASEVYKVPLEAVTPDMRRKAKAVNFGVIYGQSPFGLAKQLDIEKTDAARFIDAYFDRYQGVEEFLNSVLERCARSGYVSTILGRRRAISGIRRGATRQRNLPERTAINTVIQGSAADLIKLAMIRIQARLRKDGSSARMLLQIHDELIFEVPSEELDRARRIVVEEMSNVLDLRVPLKVDVKAGDNWADCQSID